MRVRHVDIGLGHHVHAVGVGVTVTLLRPASKLWHLVLLHQVGDVPNGHQGYATAYQLDQGHPDKGRGRRFCTYSVIAIGVSVNDSSACSYEMDFLHCS